MLSDYDIRGGVRRCAKSDRVLRPSDHYFSALQVHRGELAREDFAADAWDGPPDDAFAWWESLPASQDAQQAMAPNEVLLKLFDQWADDPEQGEARFVLTLLLVRRRVMKLEGAAGANADCLQVYCPRRDETYQVPELPPDAEKSDAIQQRISDLLAA